MTKQLPDLSCFNGCEEVFRHWTGMLYTPGIEHVARSCGAYWLLDVVSSAQVDKKVNGEEFQIWTLTVTGSSAVITCKGDTSWPVVYRQHIGYTDFPECELKMFFENGVLCLPSER